MQFKDYYETMGVARDAAPDEIKRSYRRLARKFHPDVSEEPDAEERFKEVQEAYEVLKDPEKRAAYDRFGADWKAGQGFRPQGRGLSGAPAGDQYVELEIRTPKAETSDARALYERMKQEMAFDPRAGLGRT